MRPTTPRAGAHPAAGLLDGWLHRAEPEVARRTALATRTTGGWTELSYAGLDRSSRRVAHWLAIHGVGAGDRVAIVGEAGADWVVALFGAWRRGAVAVPLDTSLGTDELAAIVGRARPSAVIASGRQAVIASGRQAVIASGRQAVIASGRQAGIASGRQAVVAYEAERVTLTGVDVLQFGDLATLPDGPDADIGRGAGDAALVVWTSGTSGTPRGVTLSFANIGYVVDQGRAAHGLDGDDRWLSILPLNHMLGLSCSLLPALATGAGVTFARTADPRQVAALMAERRVTRMTVVPQLLAALLGVFEVESRTGGLPSTCTLHCGGAPLDAAVVGRFERLGITVHTGYGLTEAAATVTMNSPVACLPGSVGRPLPGTEVRIADGGEILVRSPGVMLGYWDDEALSATAVDGEGWLHTGDLGHLDDDGFLHVTGRAKSMIVLASGKKVQPAEVEAALATSTVLTGSCVVGWPQACGGGTEQVCAVVVAGPALLARCPNDPALQRAVEAEVARSTAGLAAFKRPAFVVAVGELPKTPKRSVHRDEVVRLLQASTAGADAIRGAGASRLAR